jgi:hypothetical protein
MINCYDRLGSSALGVGDEQPHLAGALRLAQEPS